MTSEPTLSRQWNRSWPDDGRWSPWQRCSVLSNVNSYDRRERFPTSVACRDPEGWCRRWRSDPKCSLSETRRFPIGDGMSMDWCSWSADEESRPSTNMSKRGLDRVNEQTSSECESNLRCEGNRHRHKHWSRNRDPTLHCPRQSESDDTEPNWPSINKESVLNDPHLPSLSLQIKPTIELCLDLCDR